MIGVITIFLTGLVVLLLMPWLVFFLSWALTIGHWENKQYRLPALVLTLILVVAWVALTMLNVWSV